MSQFLTHSAAFMNDLAATPVWSSLGWTMWHYLWIGLIELACGILLLAMIPRFYSALRYRFLLVLFALLLVTPIFIFQSLWNDATRIDHSQASQAVVPPIWTTAPVMVHAPSQEFIEPDRMPNALQSPWKPDPDAEIPDRSLPQVAVTYPQSPPQTAPKSNGFGPLFFERLAKYVPWLPLIWMIGSPLTLLFLGLGLIGAERYRRQARVILSGDIVDRCAKLASRIGVRQKVLVAFSERVISPVLIGILKPLILLPITAETGWTPAQLEIVLLHELAHVRRWDNLVNLIQRLAEGILFFQPAVWIVSRWLTLEREHCCDELVVRVTGRAQDYATALAELALAEHLPPGVVSSMARHPLLGRIRRILGHEQPLQVSRATLTFALIFSLGCCALAGLTQSEEQLKVTVETTSKEADKKPEPASAPSQGRGWKFEDVNGKPIEGVEVSAFSGGRSYPPETWKTPELKDPKNLIGEFTSDAEGKVQVQTPDNKPFILEFKKPGFMTLLKYSESWKRWVEDQNRPEFIPIELMRAGTITVEVRGTDGLPASGVKLGCANYFRSKSLMDSTKFTNAVTDEKGQVVLTNLREGLVNLECVHTESDQVQRFWSDCLLLADGAKLIVRIDLVQSNSSINGVVKDDLSQTPLSDVTIEVEREWSFDEAAKTLDEATRRRILEGMPTNQVAFPRDLLSHGRFPVPRSWKRVLTDAGGKFDIGKKIPAGNYHLTFIRHIPVEESSNTFFPNLGKVSQKIAEKDVVLTANETVPVEVLIDEASLEKEVKGNPVEPQPTSDPVEPKQPNITPPVTLIRQIVDHHGQGLQGVKVTIYTRDLQKPSDDKILTNSSEKKILAETETDSIGAIGISFAIPDGSTPWIELKCPGYATRRVQLNEVLEGVRSEQFFRMTEGANVRFRVLDPQGQPLPGAILLLSPSEYRPTETVISDAEGIVSLNDLPPGLVGVIYPFGAGPSTNELTLKNPLLTAFVSQFEEEHLQTFEKIKDNIVFHNVTFMEEYWLDSGKTLEQTIDLRECRSRFEGTVVDKDGNAVPLQEVWIWRLRPDTPLNDNRTQAWGGPGRLTLLTDEQGRFTLNRLNSGKFMFAPLHKRSDSQRILIDGKQDYSRGFVIDPLSWTREFSKLETSPVIEDQHSPRIGQVDHPSDRQIQRTEIPENEGTGLLKRRWQVVDLAGSPIKGVEVVISSAPERQSNSTGQVNLPEKLVSDGEGWFEGTFPRGKKLRLALMKEGFLPVRLDFIDGRLQHENQEAIAIRQNESIEMMRCGTLAVTVLGTDGKPVSGKKVSLTNLFSIRSVGRNAKQDLDVTNETGEVTFRNLREGIVVLRPVEEQATPVADFNWGKPIFIADGTSNSVTIETSIFSATLEGSFSSSSGEGVEGILIEIEREFSLREELAKIDPAAARRIEPASVQRMILNRPLGASIPEKPILSSVRTGQAGQFRIEGLLPGKYVVRAMMESEKIPVKVVRPDGPQVEWRQVRLATPSQKPRHQVQRDKIVETEVTLKRNEVTSAILVSPFPQLKLKPMEDFDSLDGGRTETLPVVPPDNIKPWNSTLSATKGPPVKDAKQSPLVHIELTGDSVRVAPENLRYDGKAFHVWRDVLRTDIKTERIVEAINVMTIFGARGYEKEAVVEIADVLRRTPQTHALRASMEFSQVMTASAVALHLLGPAAIPELVAMLNSKDPHEAITALELLSPPAEDPWNWPDSLPHPSTDGMSIGRIYENAGVVNGGVLGKGNAELLATLKSLLKHPNPEIRGRVLPAAVGCQLNATETREILSTVLQDPDPTVWFSAMGMVARPTPLKYPGEALKDSYRKLKESGTLQSDRVRRNLFLRAVLSTAVMLSSEESAQYIPDILEDLKETPNQKETAYWHLISQAIPVSTEKAQSFRDAVRKAAAELPADQKTRVEETLKALDPEIDRRIKEAEDLKTPKKS